jgi:hypothetical protein
MSDRLSCRTRMHIGDPPSTSDIWPYLTYLGKFDLALSVILVLCPSTYRKIKWYNAKLSPHLSSDVELHRGPKGYSESLERIDAGPYNRKLKAILEDCILTKRQAVLESTS